MQTAILRVQINERQHSRRIESISVQIYLRSEMSQTRKMSKIANEDKSPQQIQIFKNPRDFSTHLPRHLVLQD
jgi:hypothetical protein